MNRILLVAATVALAGCFGGGPNNTEVEAAVRTMFDESNKQTARLGVPKAVTVHAVKNIGCQKSPDKPGFICDVNLDVTAVMVGRKTLTAPVRMIKTDTGWQALEDR